MEEEADNPVTDEVTQEPTNEAENEEATQDLSPEDQDTDGDESADELEEIEYSGNRYKVPKELAPIISNAENMIKGFQSDYTKKTTEVAEQRKALEAERQEYEREASIDRELVHEVGQLRSIEAELSQYQNVNWQQWQLADRDAAAAGMARMMQLQNAHRQTHGQVEGRRQEIAAIRQQNTAKALSKAIESLNKPDPDKGWDGKFDEAKNDKLTKFGREIGYTDEELAGTSHPLMIKTLHLAQIGYEALKKSRAATKTTPTVEAKPVPELSKGKGSVIKGLDDRLSTEEWVRRRNEQERRLRAR